MAGDRGQTVDITNTQTMGSMIFPFLLLVSKTSKSLGDETSQYQSVKFN